MTSARNYHTDFTNAADHTSGSGTKYFAANGGTNINQAVWMSNVLNVALANTVYRFEAWITSLINVSGGNGPDLVFEIGNGSTWTSLGNTSVIPNGTTGGTWVFTYADGQFGQAGNYYVRLRNNSTRGDGNDLGVDGSISRVSTVSSLTNRPLGFIRSPLSLIFVTRFLNSWFIVLFMDKRFNLIIYLFLINVVCPGVYFDLKFSLDL